MASRFEPDRWRSSGPYRPISQGPCHLVPRQSARRTPNLRYWPSVVQDRRRRFRPSTNTWAVDTLIANKGKVTFTIPSCIEEGQYLLRHEIIGGCGRSICGGVVLMPVSSSFTCCVDVSRCSTLHRMCTTTDHGWWIEATRHGEVPRSIQEHRPGYHDRYILATCDKLHHSRRVPYSLPATQRVRVLYR